MTTENLWNLQTKVISIYLTWFLQVKFKIEAAMGLHTRQMRSIDWLAQFRPPSGLPAAVIVHSSECYCPGNCFAQWSISFSVHVCSVWRAAWRHRFLSLAISAAALNKSSSPRGQACWVWVKRATSQSIAVLHKNLTLLVSLFQGGIRALNRRRGDTHKADRKIVLTFNTSQQCTKMLLSSLRLHRPARGFAPLSASYTSNQQEGIALLEPLASISFVYWWLTSDIKVIHIRAFFTSDMIF